MTAVLAFVAETVILGQVFKPLQLGIDSLRVDAVDQEPQPLALCFRGLLPVAAVGSEAGVHQCSPETPCCSSAPCTISSPEAGLIGFTRRVSWVINARLPQLPQSRRIRS